MLFHSGAWESDGVCLVLQSFYKANLLLDGNWRVRNVIKQSYIQHSVTLNCDLQSQSSVDVHYIHWLLSSCVCRHKNCGA